MRRPVYDRVVIRRAEGDFQSKGGIIIPDTAKENRRGEVIQTQSKKVKSSAEIGQVGTIAANGDATVGEMIASAMDNVVTLHGGKRWKAAIDYRGTKGVESVEHYFEEISDLHLIIEHGPDWNLLVRCVVTLNRSDDGEEQNSAEKALRQKRTR